MPFDNLTWDVVFWFARPDRGVGLRVTHLPGQLGALPAGRSAVAPCRVDVTPLWIIAFVSGRGASTSSFSSISVSRASLV